MSDSKAAPPRIVQITLSLLLLGAAAGSWLPPSWLWGLNHATWLSWPWRVFVPVLGLVLVWTPASRSLGRWLRDLVDPILLGNRLFAYGLAPLFGGLVFWLFRDPTHLLGDGQTLALMLTKGRLFHGFDGLTYHLAAKLYQLDPSGKPAAFRVLALISCIAGAAYLATAAWSARRLAVPGAARILLYGLLVVATPLQIFMGYAEVYAPLSIALLICLTLLIRFFSGQGRFLPAALAWSGAIVFHLNALFIAPLLVIAIFWRTPEQSSNWPRRALELSGTALVAVALLALLYRVAGMSWSGVVADFGLSADGDTIVRGLTGDHGVFSVRHLKDVFNLALLLAPVGVSLAVAAGISRPKPQRCPIAITLVGGSVWLLVLSVVLHLKLGVVRDWDLLGPHALLVSMTGWFLIARQSGNPGPTSGLVGAALGVAALLAVPWFAVNSSEGPALARLEAVATDLAPYPRGLIHEQMAYHHQIQDNAAETERHYQRAAEICPANLRFLAIYGTHLVNQGKLRQAIPVYDQALAADSTYTYGLQMAITARALNNQFEGVLPLARRLLRLGHETARTAEAHGVAAERAGRQTEAIAAYIRAAEIDVSRLPLLERAGGLSLQTGDLAGAEDIFGQLLAIDHNHTSAALGLADAIWLSFKNRENETAAAVWRPRLTKTRDLIDRVLAAPTTSTAQSAELRLWQTEVKSALSHLEDR